MSIVAVGRMENKFQGLDFVLDQSGFDQAIEDCLVRSGKAKASFAIAIKPNMMVMTNLQEHLNVTTDPELVEHLIHRLHRLGFSDIQLVEAQNTASLYLKGHDVQRIAAMSGYSGEGYRVINLTEAPVSHPYRWRATDGAELTWKHVVGPSWRDADFRISFAKCKTHNADYFTLTLKNVFGCFPLKNKLKHYHAYREVPDVTAASVWTFPIHFAVIDAFTASDGYQGYKTQAHPKPLHLMLAGPDAVCVDMECAKRGGIAPTKMRIVSRVIEWALEGKIPPYEVVGDQQTMFTDIVPQWANIEDAVVARQNWAEEILPITGLLNVGAAGYVDFDLFPARHRLLYYLFRLLYALRLHEITHQGTLHLVRIWIGLVKGANRRILRRQVW